jgi:excisionase family DNA binding protein
MTDVFTPRTLAQRWDCSERHVRALISEGELRAFRLGGKLLRIAAAEVERYECQTTRSDGSGDGSASSTGKTGSASVTRLAPMTRARLHTLRQRSTPN